MSATAPILDPRDRARILAGLMTHLPGYVPGWNPAELSSAGALMRIFARYVEILADGVNQVPGRSHMAFLDMLGTHLLPAQAAQAPLVFTLLENAPTDVTLPAGCRVAAVVQPTPPSPAPLASQSSQAAPAESIFSTRQSLTLTRAHIAALYSIHPGSDEFVDHGTDLAAGFTLFDGMDLTEHAIYLGHDHLFALGGENIVVMLSVSLERFASRELKTQWEYLTESGWSPLESSPEDDSTNGLRQDGLIMLRREKGPKAKQDTIEGHKSYWLRGRLASPLLPDGIGGERTVPLVNDIHARVGFVLSNIIPEAAYMDTVPLDISKDFYPFGQQPATRATFYLACKEVFQRKGARVRLDITLSQDGGIQAVGSEPFKQVWEYSDGVGWIPFTVVSSTGSEFNFNSAPNTTITLAFDCPPNWAEANVNGDKNYWLRVRITGGDYGHPLRVIEPVATPPTFDSTNLKPPIISKISLGFIYLTEPFELDHCLSTNDFRFEDHTEDSHWPDRSFTPFVPVADLQPAVHFGFDRALPSGLISLYIDVQDESGDAPRSSPFIWEYRTEQGWNELGVLDETLGFCSSGMIQFIGQPDAVPIPGMGGNLYRVRARLKQGESMRPLPVSGAWLNAIWADQHTAPTREELGSSDGNPGQTFSLQRQPVLNEAKLEVQEWRGRGEGWRTTLDGISESNLRFERDLASNVVTSVWVTWNEQIHLYLSNPGDRHYTLERATGLVRLGDIPPASSRIVITYSSGGGVYGNVPAGAIKELRMAIPYIKTVTNPIPASGGAQVESPEAVKQRGSQRLRHHDQAVTAEDCEWLARQASPDVARVRCLPITGPAGHAQRGWITLIAAPSSPDPQPWPSPGFRRRVREYLSNRVPASVSRQVYIVGPHYTPVSVRAEIIPHTAGEAAQVEAYVREALDRFLHPLSGGSDGQGWAFGQAVYLSQLARLIEETPGVDYASDIRLAVEDQIFADFVPIDTYALAAAGKHELKILLGVD